MRLMKFLSESNVVVSENLEDIKNIIKRDCSEFLREKVVLYKGMFGSPNSSVELIKSIIPTNRHPRATDENLYKFINNWLRKHNFVPRNKACICTGSIEIAKKFGWPYLVFPIGSFKFTYCKSEDFNLEKFNSDKFYIDYFSMLYNLQPNLKSWELMRIDIPKVSNPEMILKATIGNTDFAEAVRNKWEIWFSSKEYYLLYLQNYQNFAL